VRKRGGAPPAQVNGELAAMRMAREHEPNAQARRVPEQVRPMSQQP
jgi:hypothetical protein